MKNKTKKSRINIITTDLTPGQTNWDEPYALAFFAVNVPHLFPGETVMGFKTAAERESKIKDIIRGIQIVKLRVNKPVMVNGKQAFYTAWNGKHSSKKTVTITSHINEKPPKPLRW
ncbi:MAG TPA: hypothetical protein VHG89_04735 [Verrucomicrobiae bacterium]|nr:hypothetical protein [Verrucomicrobiae bacterium]